MVGTVENWKAEILTVFFYGVWHSSGVAQKRRQRLLEVFLFFLCALHVSGVRTEFDDSVGCFFF